MEMDDRLMTVKELAAYLNLNERTVLKLAAEGPLPAVKVGNQWRVREGMIATPLYDPMLGISRRYLHPPPTGRARRLPLALPRRFPPRHTPPHLPRPPKTTA